MAEDLRADEKAEARRRGAEATRARAAARRAKTVDQLKALGPTKCWPWPNASARNSCGYGRVWIDNEKVLAHRWVYELLRAAIPGGLVIDHLCRNRACVNPDHLELVEAAENTRRGIGPTAINARKEACPKGHPYDAENTYHYRGWRQCRTCMRARRSA